LEGSRQQESARAGAQNAARFASAAVRAARIANATWRCQTNKDSTVLHVRMMWSNMILNTPSYSRILGDGGRSGCWRRATNQLAAESRRIRVHDQNCRAGLYKPWYKESSFGRLAVKNISQGRNT
jgi:hypothetical protein